MNTKHFTRILTIAVNR